MESVTIFHGRSIPAIMRCNPRWVPQRSRYTQLFILFGRTSLGKIHHRSRRSLLCQVKLFKTKQLNATFPNFSRRFLIVFPFFFSIIFFFSFFFFLQSSNRDDTLGSSAGGRTDELVVWIEWRPLLRLPNGSQITTRSEILMP